MNTFFRKHWRSLLLMVVLTAGIYYAAADIVLFKSSIDLTTTGTLPSTSEISPSTATQQDDDGGTTIGICGDGILDPGEECEQIGPNGFIFAPGLNLKNPICDPFTCKAREGDEEEFPGEFPPPECPVEQCIRVIEMTHLTIDQNANLRTFKMVVDPDTVSHSVIPVANNQGVTVKEIFANNRYWYEVTIPFDQTYVRFTIDGEENAFIWDYVLFGDNDWNNLVDLADVSLANLTYLRAIDDLLKVFAQFVTDATTFRNP